MKSSGFALLFKSLLILSLVPVFVFSQDKTITSKTDTGSNSLRLKKYTEIPPATEPCEPVVCEWWNKLRQAANELQRREDDKSKRKFVLVFVEGLEKSYRIPLKDRSPLVLASTRPEISDIIKTGRINGELVLSVEYRADASIGEIKIIKTLNSNIDNRFIQAARQNIFLPAIKDGVFVTEWQEARLTISPNNKKP